MVNATLSENLEESGARDGDMNLSHYNLICECRRFRGASAIVICVICMCLKHVFPVVF